MVDNVLNAADGKSRNFFRCLQSRAVSADDQDMTVRAAHQITGLHLLRKQTLKYHKNSFSVPVMALVIYSQLVTADLKTNHTTNVVNIDGHKADFKDRKHKYDETSIYVMNTNEVVHALESGAYDHADAWTRGLNSSMVGLSYERPTDLDVKTLRLAPNEQVEVHQQTEAPKKSKDLEVSLVSSGHNLAYFSQSTTDNDFTFLLSDTLDSLYKADEANDDGFRIDKAVVEDAQHESVRNNDLEDQVKSAPVGHLNVQKLLNNDTKSQPKSGSARNRDDTIVNPGDVIKDPNRKAKADSMSAKKDHVTKTSMGVSDPLNLSGAIMAAKASSSSSAKTVSRSANAVNDEIDLKKGPDANGNPKLKRKPKRHTVFNLADADAPKGPGE